VLLVIGSFSSELSRAMNRQTFSNKDTAAFLNETFVCVLVDAKERRDVVALYQVYLQDVKQLSGLPMNLWLSPELKPFEGANYLPPTEEWGKEGFSTVAKRAAAAWKADAAAQTAKAEESASTVTSGQLNSLPEAVDPTAISKILSDAKEAWRARFDAEHGGFSEPPKYPEPELLRALLTDDASRDSAVKTLHAIARGALHDPLDGGFFRYAVDTDWKHPYFQKTAVDQARLALAFLDAAKITNDREFADAARDALRYAVTRLRISDGDISATEDATPEAVMPGYLWTLEEIQKVLGAEAAKTFAAAYSVTAEGNIPADAFPGLTTTGKNILYRGEKPADPAVEKSLAESSAKLLLARQARAPALRDNGATSGVHGLILHALARAGSQLQDAELSNAAGTEAKFIQEKLFTTDGKLRRLAGRDIPAAAEDLALVAEGYLAFANELKKAEFATIAQSLIDQLKKNYWNASAGRSLNAPETAPAGIWARVTLPPSGPADLPSTDATLLRVLSTAPAGGSSDMLDALRRTVAADVRDAAETARGDLLLSLQVAGAKP
jgi:uncharacterized protein YyaL (SSP411 family)